VNGQVVRKLGVGGPNQFERADALVSATDAVGNPQVAEYAGDHQHQPAGHELPGLPQPDREHDQQRRQHAFDKVGIKSLENARELHQRNQHDLRRVVVEYDLRLRNQQARE